MNESELRKQEADGTRAYEDLQHFGHCFDQLEAEYFQAWKESDPRDKEGRESLYLAGQVVGRVRNHLQTLVDGGKLAREELNHIERFKDAG